jgi:hypothetical protein
MGGDVIAERLGGPPESLYVSVVAEEVPKHLDVELPRATDTEQTVALFQIAGKLTKVRRHSVATQRALRVQSRSEWSTAQVVPRLVPPAGRERAGEIKSPLPKRALLSRGDWI